jgi:hypothetical protein
VFAIGILVKSLVNSPRRQVSTLPYQISRMVAYGYIVTPEKSTLLPIPLIACETNAILSFTVVVAVVDISAIGIPPRHIVAG